jgi:hypothetical protein
VRVQAPQEATSTGGAGRTPSHHFRQQACSTLQRALALAYLLPLTTPPEAARPCASRPVPFLRLQVKSSVIQEQLQTIISGSGLSAPLSITTAPSAAGGAVKQAAGPGKHPADKKLGPKRQSGVWSPPPESSTLPSGEAWWLLYRGGGGGQLVQAAASACRSTPGRQEPHMLPACTALYAPLMLGALVHGVTAGTAKKAAKPAAGARPGVQAAAKKAGPADPSVRAQQQALLQGTTGTAAMLGSYRSVMRVTVRCTWGRPTCPEHAPAGGLM